MSTLEDLRREIDGIDDAILDLLARRVDIGHRVAVAKGPDGGPKLRPGREAQVLRRLAARDGGRLGAATLVRFWREILSANLAQQTEFSAGVWAPEPDASVFDLARDHCGSSFPPERKASAKTLISEAGSGAVDIAVLPGLDGEGAWRWWPWLVDTTEEQNLPRIIARLPFSTPGSPEGFVVSTIPSEASGDDISVFALDESAGLHEGRVLDTDPSSGRRLVAVGGYCPERADHVGWHWLGAYASPLAA